MSENDAIEHPKNPPGLKLPASFDRNWHIFRAKIDAIEHPKNTPGLKLPASFDRNWHIFRAIPRKPFWHKLDMALAVLEQVSVRYG